MAIPKKGSRTIIVEGVKYRWLIRRKATYSQTDYGKGKIHVAVEHAANPGTTLIIHTDRAHPKDWNTQNIIPVTPSDISNWIKQALALKWEAEERGPQFSVYIESGDLKKS